MNQFEIQKQLNSVDQYSNIFDIKIENWSVWAITKRFFHLQLIKSYNSQNIIPSANNTIKIKILIDCIISKIQIFYYSCLKKYNNLIIVFLINRSRYLSRNGYFKEQFAEDIYLQNSENYDFLIVERNKGLSRKRKIQGKVHVKENFVKCNLFPSINKKLDIELIRKKLKAEINITKIDTEIKSRINKIIESKNFEKKILQFLSEKKSAKKILVRTKPKLILLTSSEGHIGLIAAAKELGINIFEFQHGVIDSFHPIYRWPKEFCNRKKELCVPDKLLLFGSYWKDVLVDTKFWKEDELEVIGNIRVEEIRENSDKNKKLLKAKKRILYTSTQSIQCEAVDFFSKTIDYAIEKDIDFQLTIKIHPKENSSGYLEFRNKYSKYVNIVEHGKDDIYSLFMKNDFHISVYSVSLFESFELGIPSGIINISNSSYFTDLVSKNYFHFFETPDNLVKYISEMNREESAHSKLLNFTTHNKYSFYSNYNRKRNSEILRKAMNGVD